MRHTLHMLIMGVIVGTIFVANVYGEIGRGRHDRLFLVPAPDKVNIDGKLNEWDLSAQIQIYVVPETKETQSAKYAMMYDSEAVYIGAKVMDPNPMMNRHDPDVNPGKGWDADACQLRFGITPDVPFPLKMSQWGSDEEQADLAKQVVHLTMWHYTDEEEPVLQMQYGFYNTPERYEDGIIPQDKYQASYRKGPEGRSYTFEYRIPWETLGSDNPPKAGDLVPGTVQFNWSRPDGRKTAGGSAWAYDVMTGTAFPYQTANCWGKFVFAEEGNVPRDLVQKGVPPEKPRPLKFEYELPKPGEVTIALYNEEGKMVRQIITRKKRNAGKVIERWDGLDDLGRPLPAGEYTWKGLYHEGLGLDFKLSVHNSGDPPYRTGKTSDAWGANHGEPHGACAIGDKMLLSWDVTEGASGMIRTDLEGNKQWGSVHCALYMAGTDNRFYAAGGHGYTDVPGVRVYDLKDGRRLNYADGSAQLTAPDNPEAEATGVAYADGTLYVAFSEINKIVRYNPKTPEVLGSWKVAKPGRLAVTQQGTVLTVSEGGILAVTDGNVNTLISEHVDDPRGIAVDGENQIYVSNRGDLQNVSVFSAEGEYLRSIGIEGGRREIGKWQAGGMLRPEGITVDNEGQLWVAETTNTPKRISVWDTESGELIDDFFGASHYATYASMDPADKSRVYSHGVQWKVNVDKGTKEPEAIVAPEHWGGLRVFTAENGRQYATADYKLKGMLLMIRDDYRFRVIGGLLSRNYFKDTDWYQDRLAKAKERFNRDYKLRHWKKNPYFLWSDRNRDGIAQESEVQEADVGGPHWVDNELSFYGAQRVGARRLAPERILDNGVPVYDSEKVEEFGPTDIGGKMNAVVADADAQSIYVLGGPFKLDDPTFPTLNKYTFEGERKWGYWRIHTKWKQALNIDIPEKGTAIGTVDLMGVAGDYIIANTYFGSAHIWNADGLYVDQVFQEGRTGASGHNVIGCEWVGRGGHFVKTEDEGRYFVLAGDQDGRVNEVTGLESVERMDGGTYTITSEEREKVAKAQEEYQARKAKSQKLVVVRGKDAVSRSEGVTKRVDEKRAFTAKAGYDDKNLYISYDVDSPYLLTNSVGETKIQFSGGNCLDIQMATNPEADPERTEPAPGDVRLVVTRQQGEPTAVLYRPEVKGFEGEPTVFESPVDEEKFDRIEEVSDRIKLDYREKQGGFKAFVTVPLELIGWTPEPASKIKMDVGYIYGKEKGGEAALRSYWSNNSGEANVVDDIPDESRLNPEHWGKAIVE